MAHGTDQLFVIDKFIVPSSNAEAREFAGNVDHGPKGTAQNQFGSVLAALMTATQANFGGHGMALKGVRPHILHLHTTDGTLKHDSSATLQLFRATGPLVAGTAPKPDPEFPSGSLKGSLTSGKFAGKPDSHHQSTVSLDLPLAFGGQTTFMAVSLLSAQVDADFQHPVVTGALHGAITMDEVNNFFLPILSQQLTQLVQHGSPDISTGLSKMFQLPQGVDAISVNDLRANPLITSLLAPDVPGKNGNAGLMSFGIGFSAKAVNP